MTRNLLIGVLIAFLVGWFVGDRFGVMHATIDLECGGKTYTVSTGNSSGECKSSGQNAVCGDSAGNSTEVSCASGCINANGSAKCEVKEKTPA